ncbi:MAG: hypothetical protein M3509_05390 [Chloroflexota bacterium]|nr:hypothetical protein [Chloroflexota bacterium]
MAPPPLRQAMRETTAEMADIYNRSAAAPPHAAAAGGAAVVSSIRTPGKDGPSAR